jgi:hypothetical protein
VDGGHPFSGL